MPLGAFKAGMFGAAGGGSGLGWFAMYGDPLADIESGIETYPYAINKYISGGTKKLRLGGRSQNSSGGQYGSGFGSGEINITNGWAAAPTSFENFRRWTWAIPDSSTWQMLTTTWQGGGQWIDSSGNVYQIGKSSGGSSYNYDNIMMTKWNDTMSSNSWYDAWRTTSGYPYGVSDGAMLKTEGTNGRTIYAFNSYNYEGGGYRRRTQLGDISDSTGAQGSPIKQIYPNTITNWGTPHSYITGPAIFSKNIYDDFFGTVFQGYWTGYGTIPLAMVWENESGNIQNQYDIHLAGVKNNSTGGGDAIYATGCDIDSEKNIYILGYGPATNVDGSGTMNNVFITKFNSSGYMDWTYVIRQQANGVEHNMYTGGIYVDGTGDGGDIYISGYSDNVSGSGTHNGPWLIKIDNDNASADIEITWATQLYNSDSNEKSFYAQGIEKYDDTVYMTGYGSPILGTNTTGWVAGFNTDGTTLGTTTVNSMQFTATDLSSYLVWDRADSGTTTPNIAIGTFNSGAGNDMVIGTSNDASDSGTISAFESATTIGTGGTQGAFYTNGGDIA